MSDITSTKRRTPRPASRRAGPLLAVFLVVAGTVGAFAPITPAVRAEDATPTPAAEPTPEPTPDPTPDPTVAPDAGADARAGRRIRPSHRPPIRPRIRRPRLLSSHPPSRLPTPSADPSAGAVRRPVG